jgi:hypothetical protein
VLTAVLVGVYLWLLREGYTTAGLFMEMVAAGALYTLVVGRSSAPRASG